jgi:hypothetical protein
MELPQIRLLFKPVSGTFTKVGNLFPKQMNTRRKTSLIKPYITIKYFLFQVLDYLVSWIRINHSRFLIHFAALRTNLPEIYGLVSPNPLRTYSRIIRFHHILPRNYADDNTNLVASENRMFKQSWPSVFIKKWFVLSSIDVQ